jgi:hypothetical protein
MGRKTRTTYLRLSPHFIARIEGDPMGWPARDSFRDFYRENGYRGSIEHCWADLTLGQAVPDKIALGFVEYLRAKRRGFADLTPESACISVRPDEPEDHKAVWPEWRTILHAVIERFEDCPEMYFESAEEVRRAAGVIVRCVGYKIARPGEALDGESCLVRGMAMMGRSADDYARWLCALWERDRHTVMAPVHRPANGPIERLGVSVILPLMESAFRRFWSGEIGDQEIAASVLQVPSKYLFIDALGEPPETLAGPHERSAAQAQCMLYQQAYFSRGQRHPILFTIAANPQYKERLKREGFREVGTCLHGTDVPIVALCHREDLPGGSPGDWIHYKMFSFLLSCFQQHNRW